MKTAFLATRAFVGLAGLTQLVLGVLFWTGHALALVPLHMLIGVAFVLALWTLAVLCGRAGASRGLVALVLAWGLVLPALGMTHAVILPGPAHWVIRVAHLLTGLVAMGLAGALTARTPALAGGRSAHGPRDLTHAFAREG